MAFPSNSNTDINSELFSKLVGAAQFAAYENSVARSIVTVFDFPANAGKVVQVPSWASISAELIADESAATAKTTNTSSIDITLKEHVVYHQVTDMLRDSSYSDVLSQLGDQSGRAIAESMDSQVFGLFSSFTEAGPGAAGELTPDYLLKAAATLRSAKLVGPFYAVLHPKQAYAIKAALTMQTGYDGTNAVTNYAAPSLLGNNVLGGYYIGSIGGITVLESALVSVDGNGDAVGAVFAPAAIGHAMRGSIALETERRAAARATDVVLTAVAGAAIINSGYGVKLTSDATL